jgi:hypothetical protein
LPNPLPFPVSETRCDTELGSVDGMNGMVKAFESR